MARIKDTPRAAPPAEPDDGPQSDGEQPPVEEVASELQQAPPRPAPAKGSPKRAATTAALDETDEFLNICYYGTEGSGKTTDAMFMANLGQILVINSESGIKARRLRQLGVKTENIRVWPDPRTGEAITFKGLEDLFWSLKGDLLENPSSWVGVVWDSVTEIHKTLLDDVVAYQQQKAERAGKERDRFFIDRSDYGVMTEQMRQLLRRYRDLPCHFAVTALERRDTDDDGRVEYGPAVTPALMTDLGGYVDLLFHCRVGEGLDENDEPIELYGAYTRKGTKYRAKDRWQTTPRLMADPFFDRVLAYVREELTADDDPRQAQARAAVARLERKEDERKSRKRGAAAA